MKPIIIDSKYSIEIDTMGNHTLIEHGRTENGVAKTITIGYYRDIPSALKKYIDFEVCDTNDVLTIAEYIKRYETAVNKILASKLR